MVLNASACSLDKPGALKSIAGKTRSYSITRLPAPVLQEPWGIGNFPSHWPTLKGWLAR